MITKYEMARPVLLLLAACLCPVAIAHDDWQTLAQVCCVKLKTTTTTT